MVTVPKFIALGVTLRVPLEEVALPVSETDTDGSEALEASVRLALLVPVAVGAKTIDKPALAPEANVYGKLKPLTEYPLPFTVAPEIVRLDPPVLETVSIWVWLLPRVTLPKFRLGGAVRYPGLALL
jgi:hypothetical protein